MLKRTEWLKKGQSKLRGQVGLKKGVYRLKVKKKDQQQIDKENAQQEAMWGVFKEVWRRRGPYSEVSGVWLGDECRTVFCHHIWPKSTHPELRYEESNIVLLSWAEHAQVEQSPSVFPEVNKRREELKVRYGL